MTTIDSMKWLDASTRIDPRRYRAARDLCRAEAPDLFFAACFLPKRLRHDVHVMRAVSAVLVQIVDPPPNVTPQTVTEGRGCAACGTGLATGMEAAAHGQAL